MFSVVFNLCLIFCLYLLLKNHITFRKRMVVIEAIGKYQIDCLHKGLKNRVDYDDMESYKRTFLRLYDFGYERILNEGKIEVIRKYIE